MFTCDTTACERAGNGKVFRKVTLVPEIGVFQNGVPTPRQLLGYLQKQLKFGNTVTLDDKKLVFSGQGLNPARLIEACEQAVYVLRTNMQVVAMDYTTVEIPASGTRTRPAYAQTRNSQVITIRPRNGFPLKSLTAQMTRAFSASRITVEERDQQVLIHVGKLTDSRIRLEIGRRSPELLAVLKNAGYL